MPPHPPTPASLADLPGLWLLKLAGSDTFKGDSTTLWRLSRTCSLFRDLVLRQRKATATFSVPITAKAFPRQLRRLCTLARSSSNIRLELQDPRGGPPAPWSETEPHIAHLLLCAMAQLGGQPLTAVKEIELHVSALCSSAARDHSGDDVTRPRCASPGHAAQGLEHLSALPMWLPVTCPNVATLETWCHLARRPPLAVARRPSTATSPITRPAALQHLQHLKFVSMMDDALSPRQGRRMQRQLAALPSLACITMIDGKDMAAQLRNLSSVTRLHFEDVEDDRWPVALERLPAQFPNLVELHAPGCFVAEDAGLEALLSLRSLRRVTIDHFSLARSHAHHSCAWEELTFWRLDVDSVARLPLEGIHRLCRRGDEVHPSRDAQAVARVAAAVKRSGGVDGAWAVRFSGEDPAALLTTLRPLLEALPAEQQHQVAVAGLGEAATPEVVQQLGQQLPAAVLKMDLSRWSLAREAWAAVLPSLPATVARLYLGDGRYVNPRALQKRVLALCAGAVRPITVSMHHVDPEVQERIRSQLAQQGDTHVTLLFESPRPPRLGLLRRSWRNGAGP